MLISGEYLYSVAATFSFLAYMLGNILWLRIFLIVASILYVITGVSLGLTSMAGWNSAYLVINLYHVYMLVKDKSTITLAEETKRVYQQVFLGMSTREFKKLVSINPFKIVKYEKIFSYGEKTDRLMIILQGKAEVSKSEKHIAFLHSGDFIGEMSFVSGNPASADVFADGSLLYAYWTHEDLKKLKMSNADTYNKFIGAIGKDLVKKLDKKNQLKTRSNT